jgi:hypothetical protein
VGIVWLASYPKSGNTWMRVFLANYVLDRPEPVDINDLKSFTFGEHHIEYFERISGKAAADLDDVALNRLRPEVQRMIFREANGIAFTKTHSAITALNNIPTILPEVTEGAIYIIRNPLDVAVSYAHHIGVGYDEAIAAMANSDNQLATTEKFAFQLLGSWSDHVLSWTTAPGLRPLVVRYEDLLARPEQAFGMVEKFLRAPHDRDRLRKAIRFSAFETLSEQEKQHGFIEGSKKAERFFRQGRTGGWRKELTPAQAERIVNDHRGYMTRFGYLTKGGKPVY